MAEVQQHIRNNNNVQLFTELKNRFPEVPDDVVRELMQQNCYIREKCIDALGHESNKYLYGLYPGPGGDVKSGGDVVDELVQPLNNTHLGDNHLNSSQLETYFHKSPHGQPPSIPCASGGTMTRQGDTSPKQPAPRRPPPPQSPTSYPSTSMTYNRPGNAVAYPQQPSQQYPQQQLTTWTPPPQWAFNVTTSTGSPQKQPSRPDKFGQNFPATVTSTHYSHTTPSPQQPTYSPQHPHPQYSYTGSPGASNAVYPPSQAMTPPLQQAHYSTNAPTYMYGSQGTSQPTSGYYPSPGSGSSTPTKTGAVFPGQGYPQPAWKPNMPGATPTSIPSLSHGDLRHLDPVPVEPSRSSSQGSLSGMDTPPAAERSSRSGSLTSPEYLAYTQALILHQRAHLEKLVKETNESKRTVEILRGEVLQMETETARRRKLRSTTFPSVDDVQKLKDENHRFIIDIQRMAREIDMYNNHGAPVPLGEVDPNFYKQITTGPSGSIHQQNRLPAQGYNRTQSSTQGQDQDQRQQRVPPPRPPPPQYVPHPAPRPPPPSPYMTEPYPPGMVPYPRAPPAQREVTPPHDPDEGENWACGACTFSNHIALDKCEMCEMPRITAHQNSG